MSARRARGQRPQIPAFLCRQTDLLARGKRPTGRQYQEGPMDVAGRDARAVEKVRAGEAPEIASPSGGRFSGMETLVVDMRSFLADCAPPATRP